nr:unnamed protein product [Callosobruchus analis]
MHKLQLEDQVSKPPITTSTITYKESSTSQVSPTHKSTITTAVEGQKPTNSNPVSVDSSSTTAQTNSEKKVCPVVLRDPQKWDYVTKMFMEKRIQYNRAVNVDLGIRIFPSRVDDYRAIVHLFREKNISYHTFPLPEERNLHVILRGIPTHVDDDSFKKELTQAGFPPVHVVRLKKRGGVPMPLYCAVLPKNETANDIFSLKTLFHLDISVEVQKSTGLIGQCHRCQRYGHAQSYCTANPKCVRCAGEHMTHLCPRKLEEVRKCANCGGDHPANASVCRFLPKRNAQIIAERRNKLIQQGVSFAHVASSGSSITTPQQPVDLSAAIAAIQHIFAPMMEATQALQRLLPALPQLSSLTVNGLGV